jgi:hypothetical protein
MSKKYHVERREFLSPMAEWGAYVIALVEDARERNVRDCGSDGYADYQEVNLRISDGSKEIALYFDLNTIAERSNTLEMLRTLVEVIGEFKKAVETEVEVLNAQHPVPKHARAASAVH